MKLIAIDMDGTLLSSDGRISEENQRAIIEVLKKKTSYRYMFRAESLRYCQYFAKIRY